MHPVPNWYHGRLGRLAGTSPPGVPGVPLVPWSTAIRDAIGHGFIAGARYVSRYDARIIEEARLAA
jgi:hypothetical protein